MDPLFLAPWRDLALILLVLEAMVIVAVPGVALYFAVRGIRALKRVIRKPLTLGQVWALRIQQGTTRATDAIAGVPIRINSSATRVSVTARGVRDYILGR